MFSPDTLKKGVHKNPIIARPRTVRFVCSAAVISTGQMRTVVDEAGTARTAALEHVARSPFCDNRLLRESLAAFARRIPGLQMRILSGRA